MYQTGNGAENPRTEARAIWLWRAPKMGRMTVRFISEVIGLLTHRPKSADLPCPGPDVCPPAWHRGKSRWKGYAAVYGWRDRPHCDWVPGVVEVTQKFDGMLDRSTIIGEAWELWREPGDSGHIEVTGRFLDRCKVPEVEALDWICPVLRTVYSVSSLFLGVSNPFLKRVTAPAMQFAPPPNALPDPETESAEKAISKQTMKEMLAKAREEGRI